MTNQYQERYKEESLRIYSNPDYRFRDKAGIFFWECLGRFAPVIAMKYAMTGLSDRGVLYESLSWIGAVALNFSPIIFKGAPLHLYGGYAGMQIGDLRANVIKKGKLNSLQHSEGDLEILTHENPLQAEDNKQAA